MAIAATKLSSKGQVIIPKSIRNTLEWEPGQELLAMETPDGVLLKPKSPFKETSLEEVGGCLPYHGKPLTLEDMEDAIRQGVEEGME